MVQKMAIDNLPLSPCFKGKVILRHFSSMAFPLEIKLMQV